MADRANLYDDLIMQFREKIAVTATPAPRVAAQPLKGVIGFSGTNSTLKPKLGPGAGGTSPENYSSPFMKRFNPFNDRKARLLEARKRINRPLTVEDAKTMTPEQQANMFSDPSGVRGRMIARKNSRGRSLGVEPRTMEPRRTMEGTIGQLRPDAQEVIDAGLYNSPGGASTPGSGIGLAHVLGAAGLAGGGAYLYGQHKGEENKRMTRNLAFGGGVALGLGAPRLLRNVSGYATNLIQGSGPVQGGYSSGYEQ